MSETFAYYFLPMNTPIRHSKHTRRRRGVKRIIHRCTEVGGLGIRLRISFITKTADQFSCNIINGFINNTVQQGG